MVIQEHIDSDICIFDSFVFSDKYKICILMINNMTIFDKIDFSPLRSISQQKPYSLNDP